MVDDVMPREDLLVIPALAVAGVAVALYYRSLRFLFGWLPIIFDGPRDQGFYEWITALIVGPLIPSIGALLAVLARRRAPIALSLMAGAAASLVAQWLLYSGMMTPGIWGDCIGCGPHREVLGMPSPPLVALIPFDVLPYVAYPLLGILVLLFAACVAWFIRNRRGERLRFAVSVAVIGVGLAAACIGTHAAMEFENWLLLWQVTTVASAAVAVAAMTSTVAARRRLPLACASALVALVATYGTVHATAMLLLT